MSVIQLKEANCKNCYKCIRHCDVKSISFHDDQARIREDECVLCGTCAMVCPQNAKQIQDDVPRVRAMIDQGARVYASLAPSFVAAFHGVSFAGMSAALKKLGFAGVEETAIGATAVTAEYVRMIREGVMPNIITTCCPTVVMLVEKYYPELTGQLAQAPSPAVAHARLLRKAHGEESKVVFIGPCISKKHEAERTGEIDAALMYDELRRWLDQESIVLKAEEDEAAREMHHKRSRLYPVPGGILACIPESQRGDYRHVAIDGLSNCIRMLRDIREHGLTGYFLEMSSCVDSCVGGPSLRVHGDPFLLSRTAVEDFARRSECGDMPAGEACQVAMTASYEPRQHDLAMPSEEEIQQILHSIGKHTPSELLNCGACGYNTCREKAIAVYRGKASLHMCLPYMRQRAESMSNTILDNTPNGIIILNQDFEITQFNRAAEQMLSLDSDCIGMGIDAFLEMEELAEIRRDGQNVMGVRRKTAIYEIMVEQSIISLPDHDYMVLLKDISQEEESMRAMRQMRKETVETAQQVIDKQMRVAQEIASLLGETTGETKAALLRLKASMSGGEGV